MYARAAVVVMLAFGVGTAYGQEIPWRTAPIQVGGGQPVIKLGAPIPVHDAVQPAAYSEQGAAGISIPHVSRFQNPDPPPPGFAPPPGGFTPPPPPAPGFIPPPPGEEGYNCGVPGAKPAGTGFFEGFWDRIRGVPKDIGQPIANVFEPVSSKGLFHSDDQFESFTSPITAPFIFEDPRALTELRPTFIWQRSRDSNPLFAGGDNFYLALQGRLAFTNWFSLTINRVGFTWTEPEAGGPGVRPAFSFSELWLGPKFTLLRNPDSGTIGALGLTFQIPTGTSDAFQDTGSLSLDPYFSIGQRFLRSDWGSFHVLNTTGWALSTSRARTNWVHTSFHLDYDVANLHKIYPLVEMHYVHYTRNGDSRALTFEGADLINFGAKSVGGRDELRIAPGIRYQHSQNLSFGVAGEWNLIGGGNHLDGFRLTTDMILRY